MNGRDVFSDKDKALMELKNNETLSGHYENLLSIFKGDPLQLTQFSLVLTMNEMLRRNEKLVVLAVMCEICKSHELHAHLQSIWSRIKRDNEQGSIRLIHHILLEKGFFKVN